MAIKFGPAPVYYIPMTKCGSTTINNLAWACYTGDLLDDQESVHSKLNQKNIAIPNLQIPEGSKVLGVVRDPVSRFISVYNDKIAGNGRYSSNWLKECLDKNYKFTDSHYEKCVQFLNLVTDNLIGSAPFWKKDDHWNLQSKTSGIYAKTNASVIPLPEMNKRLVQILEPHIPDVSALLKQIGTANSSKKYITADEIKGSELEKDILKVYYLDSLMYKKSLENFPLE